MFELDDGRRAQDRSCSAGGWTLLTAVNLMLFSLLHNPCSTTIYTIYKETGSAKWTARVDPPAAGHRFRSHVRGGNGLATADLIQDQSRIVEKVVQEPAVPTNHPS